MKEKKCFEHSVKDSRFPPTLFFIYWIVLLLMSGIHFGLLVGMDALELNKLIEIFVPMGYWAAVAIGLTIFTRNQIRRVYEEPMHKLADATKRVAEGDFSVYVAPIHTSDKLDYLDIMFMHFNKMVEELGSIETLKTDFLSNVSHEIKTPLAIIQNNAEVLCREALTEQQKQYANTIFSGSKRLADLISNILKLNKLEKQTIVPTAETYNLCEQLADCALNYEPAWEQRRLEFDADMEDCAEICADPALMELVWNNLFSNAVKFTAPGGKITLTEAADEKTIRVSIKDTGCGMAEETKKHIFEKFYQGDTSHSMSGNGLGLVLALRVLQLNGFQIEVESEQGKGSIFTVIIPKIKKEVLPEHE